MPKQYTPAQLFIYRQKLGLSDEQIDELLAHDRAVEKGEKTPHDLTREQEKISKEYRRVSRGPTVYKLDKRERKPNATKGAIIDALNTFLSQASAFQAENVQILNKERQISFQSGGETFELTLVQKRKSKK